MALACPVCDRPQADAEHLANHLAITASLHEAEHADWLDAHVPGWADSSPSELGAAVESHAEEVSTDEQAWDTAGGGSQLPTQEPGVREHHVSADTERILEEARELTERMIDDETDDADGD